MTGNAEGRPQRTRGNKVIVGVLAVVVALVAVYIGGAIAFGAFRGEGSGGSPSDGISQSPATGQ
ncbi:hypothetical protein EDC02_3532 [Micromonospora sp. Llam0]|nr:hypothetical protein EDC02_3532 [Micromonospora sp. Llam0]